MYEQISRNIRNSYILITFFIIVIALLGYVFGQITRGGYFGVVIALMIAIVMSLVGYYQGDKIVLAMSRAKRIEKKDLPVLFDVVEEMTVASGLPMPAIYVINDPSPNAFATGRNPESSSIAVTTGLLDLMNRSELQGVIAHEMSHVQNYDIRFMMLVGILVGTIALLSDFMLRTFLWGGIGGDDDEDSGGGLFKIVLIVVGLILAILAPVIATLIQLAISRKREFLADASGAQMTRYPEGLASALEKLESSNLSLRSANKATAHLYIVNPLKNLKGRVNLLFNTHPPIEERVKALRAMAGEMPTG